MPCKLWASFLPAVDSCCLAGVTGAGRPLRAGVDPGGGMDPGVGSGALLRALAVRSLSFAAAVCPSLRPRASFPLLCKAHHSMTDMLCFAACPGDKEQEGRI